MEPVNKIDLHELGVRTGDRVLDLGCSSGVQAVMLAERGLAVFGVDNSALLAAQCAARARSAGVPVDVVVADAGKLPYRDCSFSALVSTEVFEHLPDPALAAREAYRVLRGGGRACIAVPTARSERLFRRLHPHWVEDSGHVQLFTENDLLGLLRTAGFRVEHTHGKNVEWSAFWIMHSLLRSRFDFTGTPTEHQRASDLFHRVWQRLRSLRWGPAAERLGNRLLPKSVYVYAVRDRA